MADYYSQGWTVLVVAALILTLAAASSDVADVCVYYESLCPDSQQFVQRQLLPAHRQIGQRMRVELVPYGNAHYKKKGALYTFSCQHGPDECYGNMVQTCFLHLVNNTESQLKFVDCAFNYPGSQQREILQHCVDSPDLRSVVQKCVDGPLGSVLEYEMAKRTDALRPTHTFIPWITVDGRGGRDITDKACEDLVAVVCEALTGDKPEVCSKKKKNLLMKFRNYYL